MMRKVVKILMKFLLIGIILLVVGWGIYEMVNFAGWPKWTGLGEKTAWDVLELLIIPVTLAVVAAYLDRLERNNDRENVKDNQREALLQSYIEFMTRLVLEKGLSESKEGDKVREIGQVKTTTTLERLDLRRKETLVKFLVSMGLVLGKDKAGGGTYKPIISLSCINLAKTNLNSINLHGADLSTVILSGANLHEADLSGANLHEAELSGADLSGAFLVGTNLSEATMCGANLNGVDFWRASLCEANLRNASLCKAMLLQADLSKSILIKANLSDAKLNSAILHGASLNDVMLKGATMPDGKIYDPKIHTVEMLTKPKKKEGEEIG